MPQRAVTPASRWHVNALFVLVLILLSPLLVIAGLLLALPWIIERFVRRPGLLRRVRKEWLPQDKFILFIYSDGQPWKDHAENGIIPKIAPHAVILNWSKRKQWIGSDSLEARLFRNFNWGLARIWRQSMRMGAQDYNHMAIVFRPWNKPRVISFRKAVKDFEFGNDKGLKAAEKDLFSYL